MTTNNNSAKESPAAGLVVCWSCRGAEAAAIGLVVVLMLVGGIFWEHFVPQIHRTTTALTSRDTSLRVSTDTTVVLLEPFGGNEKHVKNATDSSSTLDDVDDATGRHSAQQGGTNEILKDFSGREINPLRPMDPVNHSLFTCPRFRIYGNDADKKKLEAHITKYTRYAQDYCGSTGMLQMNIPGHAHLDILNTIARMARIKENDVVFDWGCGCGTMLNYLHLKHNTTGVGIDVTESAIKFAWQHSQPRQTFCWMDGTDMSRFPSERFDAVVSWGAVYHVRRTMVQCDIIRHFVRILKPGGVAFVGHIRTDKSQEYWKRGKCVPAGAGVVRYRDYKTFRQSSWKRHGFFSLVVTKSG